MSTRVLPADSSIHFDLIIPSMVAANHKQVTRMTAHEIAKVIGITERILADRLTDMEKENPSAMGDGTAVTHLHISGLQNPMSVFIRLKTPIDIQAPDKQPVDIICLHLTPEREGAAYLRTLARISRLLRNAQICTRLRLASDEKEIRNILEQSSVQLMAA